MPIKRKQPGVLVQFIPEDIPHSFTSKFEIREGISSQVFIVGPKISKAIETTSYKGPRPEYLGYMTVKYDPKSATVTMIYYYPISKGTTIPLKGWVGKEITTQLEMSLMREIKRRYPRVERVKFFSPSSTLTDRLNRLGFDQKTLKRGIKYSEYLFGLKSALRKRNYKK